MSIHRSAPPKGPALTAEEAERYLVGSLRGMTAHTLACIWRRTMTPAPRSLATAADALDELVGLGKARRVDGERLGNGGRSSTTWWPR